MEIIKVPRYQVQAPAKKPKHAFAVQTPEDGIPLHQLGLIVGRKGGGKGYALFSMLRQLKKEGYADRIWVLSPTCQSNKDLYQSAGVREEDMIVDATNNALNWVLAQIDQEKRGYDQHHKAIKDRKALMKLLKNPGIPIDKIDPELLLNAYSNNMFEQEPPPYKFDLGRPASRQGLPPVLHIVLDDVQGTELMAGSYKAPLHNLAMRHRHVAGGLGCSIWLVCQSFKAQAAGLPRSIRENASLIALFKVKDKQMIKCIQDSYAGDLGEEQFMKAYEYATNKPFGFLAIDFGSPESRRFRAGWDEIPRFPAGKGDMRSADPNTLPL